MKKRVFALLLCLVLCLSILPVGAFADEYCEHAIVKMEAKATCGEAHREHYKCTKCGKLFSDERGEHEISYESVAQEKLPHTSELKHVEFKDASCTESGNYEYWLCTECGQMFSENPGYDAENEIDNRRTRPIPDDKVKDYTIEPYGHDLTFHEAVPHTCFENGNIAYYQCSNCWWSFSDPEGLNPLSSVTDPAAHVKTEYPAVAPTCDTDGSSYYFYCSICGKYYNEYGQEIEEGSWVIPAGHDYVEHPFQEPTCTAGGNRLYYTCSGCDKVFDADLNETTLEAVTLNMIPHSLVIHVPAVAKSCYTDGNVEYWQCASCGAKFADAEGTLPLTDEEVVIPACHEFVATPAKEPTCTEPGNIAYWTCTAEGCGIIVDESGAQIWNTVVPATGHKPVKVERTTTCTEAGVAEHYKCEACGRLFLDESCTVEKTQEDLQEAAFGHDYDMDGRCTRCGAISPDTPEFNGENYVSVPTPQGTWQQVVVRVSAPQGVFPAGAQLSAQVVVNVDAETEAAVDAAREEGTNRVASYTFDIKVLDRYGYEVQPADDSRVNVSFALAEVKNDNLNATVYHVKEEEDGSKSAEALETTVEGEGENKTVVVETDGFSLYTVEFTYQTKTYTLSVGDTVPVADIASSLELTGTVKNVEDLSSASDYYVIKNESGVFSIESKEEFTGEKKIKVTMTSGGTDTGFDIVLTCTQYTVTMDGGTASLDQTTWAATVIGNTGASVYIKASTSATKTFDHWEGSEGVSFVSDKSETTSFIMPSKDVGITAVFKNRVTFVENVSATVKNMPEPQMLPDNGKIDKNKVTTPSADGYRFLGWYDKDGKPFDFEQPITINTNVIAHWVKTWKVYYTTEHGKISDIDPNPQIVDNGSKTKEPAALSWIGYKWGKWFSLATGKEFNFNSDTITEDTYIYANWIPDFKITKGNGGTAHYGSTYAFTLNYYYPDYLSNEEEKYIDKDKTRLKPDAYPFSVYVAKKGSGYSELNRNNYVIQWDSSRKYVTVTLKASYVRTLSDGATYNILFDTGDFEGGIPIDLGATEGTFKVSKSPKTGDESNIALWAAIAGVSLIAVVVIAAVLLNKRKKGKKAPTPPETRSADKTRKPPKE